MQLTAEEEAAFAQAVAPKPKVIPPKPSWASAEAWAAQHPGWVPPATPEPLPAISPAAAWPYQTVSNHLDQGAASDRSLMQMVNSNVEPRIPSHVMIHDEVQFNDLEELFSAQLFTRPSPMPAFEPFPSLRSSTPNPLAIRPRLDYDRGTEQRIAYEEIERMLDPGRGAVTGRMQTYHLDRAAIQRATRPVPPISRAP